jgi:oligosaccharide repeat unit polymerase
MRASIPANRSLQGSLLTVVTCIVIVLIIRGFSIWGSADPGIFLLWVTAAVFAPCYFSMLKNPVCGLKLSAMFLLGALAHMTFSYLTYALFLDDFFGMASNIGDYIYQALAICVIGFFAMIVGLNWHTWRRKLPPRSHRPETVNTAIPSPGGEGVIRRSHLIALLASGMAAYIFWKIGFLPLFSKDPNAVRYFDYNVSNSYQIDYSIFRRSVALFSMMLPFYWLNWKERRSFLSLLCCGVGVIVLVGSGQRIQVVIAALTVFVVRYVRGELQWKHVLGTVTLGTIFIVITQSLLLQQQYTLQDLGVFGGLASVFGEIRDLGWLLTKSGTDLLYGRTYLADIIPLPKSLVPFKQLYGLTEVTKSAIGMAEVDSFAGLRVMAFGEAFLNFWYWGVIAIGFLLGRLLSSLSTRFEALGGNKTKDALSVYPFALLWTQFATKVYFGGSMAVMDVVLSVVILIFLYGPAQLRIRWVRGLEAVQV